MGARRSGREAALQMLFQLEASGVSADQAIELFWRTFEDADPEGKRVRGRHRPRRRRQPRRHRQDDHRGLAELAPRAHVARRSQPPAARHVGAHVPRRTCRAPSSSTRPSSSRSRSAPTSRAASSTACSIASPSNLGRKDEPDRLMVDLRFVAPDLRRLDEAERRGRGLRRLEGRAAAHRASRACSTGGSPGASAASRSRAFSSATSARCSSCRRARASPSTSCSPAASGRARASATRRSAPCSSACLDALDGLSVKKAVVELPGPRRRRHRRRARRRDPARRHRRRRARRALLRRGRRTASGASRSTRRSATARPSARRA